MASCEEGQEAPLLHSGQHHFLTSFRTRGYQNKRFLFGALLGVILVAVVAAACVAVKASYAEAASGVTSTIEAREEEIQDERPTLSSSPVSTTRPPAGPFANPLRPLITQPAPSRDGSCVSQETETNTPAAHIKGHGIERGKWIESTEESGSIVPGYQQRWQCNDVYNSRRRAREQAFVDGGVWFNQTDKSIYVPRCGYYLVYSQVLFMMDNASMSEGTTVFHNLKIKHNCTWESDSGPIQLQAKASVAPYGEHNPYGGVATTHTSDVVHMCGGGSVWIEIPDGANGVLCCPRGDESSTFLGLVLIADTPCSSWPPVITMTHEY